MKPIIDLSECLRDSPAFRASLEENEEDIDILEQKLEKLVKLCTAMVESGKAFIRAKNSFINGIGEIAVYFKDDTLVVKPLNRLISAMTEMAKYHSILIDQANRAINKNLANFMKNDIRQVRETKKCFEKISDDLDNALHRNSQAPRSKPNECEEAKNILTAVRSCFQHTALDYVCQISSLQSKKRFEVLDTLLSLMHAYSTYFHQGWDLFEDLDPFLKQVANVLTEIKEETTELDKKLDSRHTLVTPKDVVPVLIKNPDNNGCVRLEGYLFKRTSNAFKTWNRRWFIIQNNQLVYRKRTRDDTLTVMEEDLRLCSVKVAADLDRRFCFEVLSPSKSHMLQADSEEACQQWFVAMQAGIDAALNHTLNDDANDNLTPEKRNNFPNTSLTKSQSLPRNIQGPPPKPPRAHSQILSIRGNELCCDCRSPDPRWASINLGITLCIECSGIHRSLGVHVSKVRSLTLDAWEPELLKVMAELGNTVVNRVYEAAVNEEVAMRATPDCSRTQRELWIKAKYIKKAFVKPLPGTTTNSDTSSEPLMIRQVPRRWSVRKVNRRRRTIHLSEPAQNKSGEKQQHNQLATRRYSASCVGNETPPAVVVTGSFGDTNKMAFINELQEQAKSHESNESGIDSLSIEDTLMQSLNLSTSASSEGLVTPEDKTKCIGDQAMEKSPDEEVLIFGENLEEECPVVTSMDLDSADESPVADDDTDDTTPEEDISKLHPNLLLYRAAAAYNLPVMSEALAHGADPNWRNAEDGGRYPLHQAIASGSIMACEYLMLNGAKSSVEDFEGKTPLHIATDLGHTGQVCLLLKRGADQHAKDKAGDDALTIAINKANADIVTLLRLAKLNEEIRRDEYGNLGDETFNEVVRDFSQMASNNPEKLCRNSSSSTLDSP